MKKSNTFSIILFIICFILFMIYYVKDDTNSIIFYGVLGIANLIAAFHEPSRN